MSDPAQIAQQGFPGLTLLAAVRMTVKSREIARIALRQRFAFGVVGFKPALDDVDQDAHWLYLPINNSQMVIFQEPLVEAAEDVRPDMVSRDWPCLPGFVYNRKISAVTFLWHRFWLEIGNIGIGHYLSTDSQMWIVLTMLQSYLLSRTNVVVPR